MMLQFVEEVDIEEIVLAYDFEDLRVEIGSWDEVTPAFLDQKWAELRGGSVERAYFPFWLHEMTARAARLTPNY